MAWGSGISKYIPKTYGGTAPVAAPKPMAPVYNVPAGFYPETGRVDPGTKSTGSPTWSGNWGLGGSVANSANAAIANYNSSIPNAPKPGAGLEELGFDPDTDAIMRRIKQETQRAQADYAMQTGTVDQDAIERRRRLEQERDPALRGVLEQFAGRGMAHSGKYITERADTDRRFQDQFADIDRGRAEQISALARTFAGFQGGMENTEQDAIQALVRKRIAEAEAFAKANPGVKPLPKITNKQIFGY